jgi:hypothetical protein
MATFWVLAPVIFTFALIFSECSYYHITHRYNMKEGKSLRNSPGSLTGRQGSLSQVGWCPRLWHNLSHLYRHTLLGCWLWLHTPLRHDSKCWSDEHGGESLAQSKHLEGMAQAASVHLHLREMSKPWNIQKQDILSGTAQWSEMQSAFEQCGTTTTTCFHMPEHPTNNFSTIITLVSPT